MRKWVVGNPYRKGAAFRKSVYGLDEEIFDAMVIESEGRCAICSEITRYLVVDHCHSTGVARGLVCPTCNGALGMVRDSIEVLHAMETYLRDAQARQAVALRRRDVA